MAKDTISDHTIAGN